MPSRGKEDPASNGRSPGGGMLARLIVGLRFLILPAWIAAALLAATYLPSVFDSQQTPQLGGLLPSNSKPLLLEERSVREFGLPLLSRTIVVASRPQGFSAAQGAAATRYITSIDSRSRSPVRAVPVSDAPGVLGARRLGSALVVYLYPDPGLSESQASDVAEKFGSGLQRVTGATAVNVTGAVPASSTATDLTSHDLSWVELATLLLVVVILAVYFRSIGIPLLGLATVAIAYVLADHVLGWMSGRYGIDIPREVEPVLVALLFGTLTDYLVFFVSGYRRRLEQGARPKDAAVAVTGELLPVVSTAALMIAGAALTLLISGVHFLSAFGPAMAVAVLIGAAVALTFVPAALAVFGRLLLRSSQVRGGDQPLHATVEQRQPRGRLVSAAASHPLLISVLGLLVLGAAATGVAKMRLGNPVLSGLPSSTSARQGYNAAGASLGPGVLGPTQLVVEGKGVADRTPQLAQLETRLSGQPGVAGVVGPAHEPLQRRYGVLLAPSGNAARFIVVLKGDPDGAHATQSLSQLESALPGLLDDSGLTQARAGVTGDTAIAGELNSSTWQALARVAPAALLLLFLLLWLLLRSWGPPLYLVGVSLLTVAASLGLTVYVFQDLLGYAELTFFVPVAAGILLFALGADYNVFLIARIWREAEERDLQAAVRIAGSRAARAITVAGLILALSFATVALIPIDAFRQLAFAMCVGLLIDTLLVRTLLIPALISLFGPRPRRASLRARRADRVAESSS